MARWPAKILRTYSRLALTMHSTTLRFSFVEWGFSTKEKERMLVKSRM